ncbi:M protein [Mycobacterium sp. M1]|uniref:M protein n=1 Tax=Mycolicibacter acidiphilus TaxID=2835306 RepID=A0ABS5RJ13_9MYCO|nr:M protein [Mycolicibacter acidiphilus]MBS9534288.1 M protein [Mycolicibacter acidiphilus]
MNSDDADDVYQLEHTSSSAKFEVERVSVQIDTHYATGSLNEFRSALPRMGSRIVALSEQLNKSQSSLESTSARFNEVAAAIPGDISDLSERLSGILNGAMTEAEDIRSAAERFAAETRSAAKREASALLAEARAERESVAELRAELEAQHSQLRAHAAQLRQQAVLSAAEIMEEAESQAMVILAQMNDSITAQVTEAQERLNELIGARAKIIDQIRRSTVQVNRESLPRGTNFDHEEGFPG